MRATRNQNKDSEILSPCDLQSVFDPPFSLCAYVTRSISWPRSAFLGAACGLGRRAVWVCRLAVLVYLKGGGQPQIPPASLLATCQFETVLFEYYFFYSRMQEQAIKTKYTIENITVIKNKIQIIARNRKEDKDKQKREKQMKKYR